MAENPPHSYTYPKCTDADSDRNGCRSETSFGITSHKEAPDEEYRHTDTRMQDLDMGDGRGANSTRTI